MRNTRTIKVGERVIVPDKTRGTFEGIVTENNPASALIYVNEFAYERYAVRRAAPTLLFAPAAIASQSGMS